MPVAPSTATSIRMRRANLRPVLTLLFHMHQPDYRDPATGSPTMPWVRLHASRGYRDMPWLAARLGAPITLNLVPSLIDQLDHYARGGSDRHLDLCRVRAEDLDAAQVAFIREHFFHGAPPLFDWFPAFGELRRRRDAGDPFTPRDLRDVQTWCNLAWFGFSALHDFPRLAELRQQGRGFGEIDLRYVLDTQLACLRDLRSQYAAHARAGEVSASPYYHPILPLLIDTAHARRCLGAELPDPGFAFPRDALHQLARGRARAADWVGADVVGLWPSEGSVSPEVIDLAHEVGFRWFATDQGVLERSRRDSGSHFAGHDTLPAHRRAWRVGPLTGLFRDRDASDRIGFLYRSWDGPAAAADLRSRLGAAPALLALDGENPWEWYRDAGHGFLSALLAGGGLRTARAWAEESPRAVVHALHSGSWIGADFATWIGHPEDRVAWSLLADARRAWERAGEPEAARESLYAAEGSDWCWWYGPEHETPFSAEFDRCFRGHLRAAYAAMELPAPPALEVPIKTPTVRWTPPSGPLPPLDTPDPWSTAGTLLLAGSSMDSGNLPRRIRVGLRDGEIDACVDPPLAGWTAFAVDRGGALELHAEGPGGMRLPAQGAFRVGAP
jgi:alpha-amylase/alpha-mannosidase (GH57 family)